jgi:nitrite reductase (NADH) large subunit
MEAVVDTYQCEWKTTLENPESRKRFRQFVNSKAQDDNVIFVQERDQVRPATESEKASLKSSPDADNTSINIIELA